MDTDLSKLAERLQFLTTQAYAEYKPLVDDIIANKRTNQKEIRCLLSLMLDFCSDDEVLSLYKKLCRYYWDINPQVTANYINYFREMWDSDED